MIETIIGTTGSTFNVVFETKHAVVGMRNIDDEEEGKVRIRIEPKNGARFDFSNSLGHEASFKTPEDGNERYSVVVSEWFANGVLSDIFLDILDTAEVPVRVEAVFYGPGGTAYENVFQNENGRVGVGTLSEGKFRVRVEPFGEFTPKGLSSWTQPVENNNRYSKYADTKSYPQVIATAISSIL